MIRKDYVFHDPTRTERIRLVKDLKSRFDLSDNQCTYLAVTAYGFMRDLMDELQSIDTLFCTLKSILEGMEIK